MSRQRGSSGTLLLVLGVILIAAVGYLLFQPPAPGPGPDRNDPTATSPEDPELPAPASSLPLEVRPGDRETLRSPAGDGPAASGDSGTIFGMVMNQENLPVAGARVMIQQRLSPAEMFFSGDEGVTALRYSKRTNQDGRYWFDDLPLETDFDMWVTHPDYAGTEGVTLTVLLDEQTVPPVVLGTGYRVLGTVTDSGGNPLAATLTLQRRGARQIRPDDYDQELEAGRRIVVEANADGSFLVDKLGAGIWSLTAQHEGYADHVEQAVVLSGDSPSMEKRIVLGSEFQIAGLVRDAEGNPVPEAKIYVARSRPRPLYSSDTVAGADGRFVLRGLPEGVYTVTAEATGYSRASVPRVDAGKEDLEIVVHQRGSVSGRITGPDGRPVTRFSLELFQVNRTTSAYHQLGERRDFKGPSGDFLFEDIEPGTYRLLASGPGFSPTYSVGFTVDRSEVQGIDVQLGQGGTLLGRVVDQQGQPVPNAEVRVHGRDWTEDSSFGLFGGRAPDPNNVPEQVATTDARGQFELRNAYPGSLKVEFSHGSFLTQTLMVEMAEGARVDAGTVTLRRGGVIFGVGLAADGSPLAGGGAFLSRQDDTGFGGFARNGRLDAQGRFRFEGLRTGTYRVTVAPSDAGGFSLFPETEMNSKTVYVNEGQKVELRLSAQ